jgi:DNA-binding MarR family transcriptional regulator
MGRFAARQMSAVRIATGSVYSCSFSKLSMYGQTMATDFPVEIEQFIGQHIESLAQLESLLLMRREPERTWNCEDLARQLYVTPDVCTGIIADLERRGFVVRETSDAGRFRYRSADASIDALIDQLADLYHQRRVAVITQIYSKPVKKVQTFADAFRLRREP